MTSLSDEAARLQVPLSPAHLEALERYEQLLGTWGARMNLTAIVDAGPEAFDDAAVGTLLQGSVGIVSALSTGECDGFLDG